MTAFETLRAIRDLHGLAVAHKAVLYAMVLRSDASTGECWPSYPTLAADAGVSLALAKRTVKELERAGHITVRRCVDASGRSQVNRYVVNVRRNVGSTQGGGVPEGDDALYQQDDAVHQKNDPRCAVTSGVVSERDGGGVAATPYLPNEPSGVVSQRDDVVYQGHDGRVMATRGVVSQRDGGGVAATPYVPNEPYEVVSQRDDVVYEGHDGRVMATRGVVSQRHGGGVAATPDLPNELPIGRSFAPARSDEPLGRSEVVSRRDDVAYQGRDGRVAATRGVVSQRHGDGVVATPDLPNELPNGRSFALARSDQTIGPAKGRPRRAPVHPPELIAAKNAVVAEFMLCCETKKGTRPKKVHERDHAAAFALAKTYGADEARSIVRRAFDDDFVLTKCTTIAFIESKAETYRGNATPRASGRRELQALVGDEPWLKEHRT